MPKNKIKQVISFSIVSLTIGIGLAVIIGGVVTQYFQWQDCFWVLLFHGILMFILTYLYQETLEQPKALNLTTIFSGYLQALKSTKLISYSLILGTVSVFSYCYSAAAPIYAQNKLHLLASQYGYWNILNMAGMLGSGFLSAYLMKKYDAKKVLLIGFSFMGLALISLILLTCASVYANINNAIWFFITTSGLYLFGGLLFPSASYFASNAIEDKASASSMMSFINMSSAMLSVVILGYLPLSSILAFMGIVTAFYLFGFGLLLARK